MSREIKATRARLADAIDALADKVPNGHLEAGVDGAGLLIAAKDRITELEAEITSRENARHDYEMGIATLQKEQAKLARALGLCLTRMGISKGPWSMFRVVGHTGYVQDADGGTWIDDDFYGPELVKALNNVEPLIKD